MSKFVGRLKTLVHEILQNILADNGIERVTYLKVSEGKRII